MSDVGDRCQTHKARACQKCAGDAGAPEPYAGKSVAEIVHDYAVIRGDLTEQYARDQLVRIIEGRIGVAEKRADDNAYAGIRAEADARNMEIERNLLRITLRKMVDEVERLTAALAEAEANAARLADDGCIAVGCRALAERDRLTGVVAKVRELADDAAIMDGPDSPDDPRLLVRLDLEALLRVLPRATS